MNAHIDSALTRLLALTLAPVLLVSQPAQASISEPHHVLYGNARLRGEPVPEGTVLSLVLTGQTDPVARYAMGSDPALGRQYALRIPMDSVQPRAAGTAWEGDEATVYLDGMRSAKTVISERGTAVRLDVDPTTLSGAEPNLFIDHWPTEIAEGDDLGQTVRFTVHASAPVSYPVSVHWATADGSATGGGGCSGGDADFVSGTDYVAAAGTVTLIPGETSAPIDLEVCGDTAKEGDETFTVSLSNAAGGVIVFGTDEVTIVDDDLRPVLTITGDSVREPPVGSVDAVFEVSLTEPWDSDVQVDYETMAGTATAGDDFVPVADTLTIPAGEDSGVIRVSVLADAVTEGTETFEVYLESSPDLEIGFAIATATIVDPASSATLRLVGSKVDGDAAEGISGLAGVSSLVLSPGGRHLYAGGRFSDSLVLFERARDSGDLQYLTGYDAQVAGFESSLLDGVVDLEVSPDGAQVYAAAYGQDGVSVFARDQASGELSLAGSIASEALAGVTAMVMARDGAHVYAVGQFNSTLVALERNLTTGLLEQIDLEQNGFDGVDGIERPSGVAISPDGAQVYVTGAMDDAVALFARDNDASSEGYGTLRYVTSYWNLVDGVDGIGGAAALAITPDGHHVYVTGPSDDAVAVFARDAETGELAWLEMVRHGDTGVAGLTGSQALATSGDGRYLYVTGLGDDSLVIFHRDTGTDSPGFGSLTAVDNLFDNEYPVYDLAGPVAVTMSPDDLHVYVAASIDNAISIFERYSGVLIFEDGFE